MRLTASLPPPPFPPIHPLGLSFLHVVSPRNESRLDEQREALLGIEGPPAALPGRLELAEGIEPPTR